MPLGQEYGQKIGRIFPSEIEDGIPFEMETRVTNVVSSNPGTIYWMDIMDIFSHLFVVKIVMCV